MFTRSLAQVPTAFNGSITPVTALSSRRLVSAIPSSSTRKSNMATATKLSISPKDSGVLGLNPSPDASLKASEVLQRDMEKHHMFFNDSGFHNHIAHQVLSLHGIAASPKDIQHGYDNNSTYQRPAKNPDRGVVESFKNEEDFKARLGKMDEYPDYLDFFQREISEKGVGTVLNEYIFARTELAEDLFARLFAGVLHPIIHLGFGLEFNQPAIVAQALAQTAVHKGNVTDFLTAAEQAAGGPGKPGNKTLVQTQKDMREDAKLRASVLWEDENKIRDGVMKRAPEEMVRYASEFSVGPNQIDEKVAEMINAVVYYTGAAQNPSKKIKFDFFYMHCLNSAIFLPTFIAQPWLSTENKTRLLEWKGRMDLLIYASRGCAEPRPEDITSYKASRSWDGVFTSIAGMAEDDGHAVKFVRLLAYGEKACKAFEGKDGFPVTGDMWIKLANMVVDSTSGPEDRWVRSAGFPEAWNKIPSRAQL